MALDVATAGPLGRAARQSSATAAESAHARACRCGRSCWRGKRVSALILGRWATSPLYGWMVLSVTRRAGQWRATHLLDRRPLAPYVSPSERWPSASELFGPIWRLRELRPDGGEASLPTTSVGLTFTPYRDGIGVSTYNGSQRTGDAAPCDGKDGTLRFGNWANNLIGPSTALYGHQRKLFLAILDGDVAWALQPATPEDHLELTKEAVGSLRLASQQT
jgi:hypothetical protein